MLGITLTFIVYNVLLLPVAKPENVYTWKNYTLHYIVPVLCILDCLIYDKVRYKWQDPLYWTIFPLFYAIFTLIKGIIYPVNIPGEDSPFPYFFVDISKLGASGVAKYIVVICIFYIIMGYILLFIKKIGLRKWSSDRWSDLIFNSFLNIQSGLYKLSAVLYKSGCLFGKELNSINT